MIAKEQIIEQLKKCFDPEINLDVWTLGLIYAVEVENNKVNIVMTFTTPFCPYGEMLLNDISNKIKCVDGVKDVDIEVVFDPPWEPTEEVKMMMGI